VLLPTGTGKVALATSVISYFSMFAQLGDTDVWHPGLREGKG